MGKVAEAKKGIDGWGWLAKPSKWQPEAICVIAGKEFALRRAILDEMIKNLLPEGKDDLGYSTFTSETEWRVVLDELCTLPFTGTRRVVTIRDSDDFISDNRDRLERYYAKPSSTGVLLLDVESWKSNTKLAKAVPESATFLCEPLTAYRLGPWISNWCKKQYGKQLEADALHCLLESLNPDFGIIDQELKKLITYVGDKDSIDRHAVEKLVAENRSSTVWSILDALAAGTPSVAIRTLKQVIEQGENAVMLLGGLGWQLKKMAQAYQLSKTGTPLYNAVSQVGIMPFKNDAVQKHLRQLGPRSAQIYDWMLEAENGLKGGEAIPPEMVLERLILKLI